MKLIRPKDWITPDQNMNGIGDVSPLFAHIGTLIQTVTYPIAAVVSGVGSVVTKNK